jgi:hypothetical protein
MQRNIAYTMHLCSADVVATPVCTATPVHTSHSQAKLDVLDDHTAKNAQCCDLNLCDWLNI